MAPARTESAMDTVYEGGKMTLSQYDCKLIRQWSDSDSEDIACPVPHPRRLNTSDQLARRRRLCRGTTGPRLTGRESRQHLGEAQEGLTRLGAPRRAFRFPRSKSPPSFHRVVSAPCYRHARAGAIKASLGIESRRPIWHIRKCRRCR